MKAAYLLLLSDLEGKIVHVEEDPGRDMIQKGSRVGKLMYGDMKNG